MAAVNVRGLPDDAHARLQAAADAEGVSVSEIARRALTAYGSQPASNAADQADEAMRLVGFPKWSRDKVLAVINGTSDGRQP